MAGKMTSYHSRQCGQHDHLVTELEDCLICMCEYGVGDKAVIGKNTLNPPSFYSTKEDHLCAWVVNMYMCT